MKQREFNRRLFLQLFGSGGIIAGIKDLDISRIVDPSTTHIHSLWNVKLNRTDNLLSDLLKEVATKHSQTGQCYPWSPRNELMPKCRVESCERGIELEVESNGLFGCHGGWELVCPDLNPDQFYKISIMATLYCIADPLENVSPEIYFYGESSNPVDWAFIEHKECRQNMVNFEHIVKIPKGTKKTVIQLLFRWTGQGRVRFSNLCIVQVAPPEKHVIRTAVAGGLKRGKTIEENITRCLNIIRHAAREGAQMILLPETIISDGVSSDPWYVARPIPGKETGYFAKAAIEHNMYVGFTMYESNGPMVHNTGLLFDPQGNIVLKYRKVHPSVKERRLGITPGNAQSIAYLPFGNVGMQICYDNVHPEGTRELARRGAHAELIPIMGDPRTTLPHDKRNLERWLLIMRMRALDNHVWMLVACNHPENSVIINPAGDVLALMKKDEELIFEDVDFDFRTWSYIGSDFRNRYWRERRPSTFKDLVRTDFF